MVNKENFNKSWSHLPPSQGVNLWRRFAAPRLKEKKEGRLWNAFVSVEKDWWHLVRNILVFLAGWWFPSSSATLTHQENFSLLPGHRWPTYGQAQWDCDPLSHRQVCPSSMKVRSPPRITQSESLAPIFPSSILNHRIFKGPLGEEKNLHINHSHFLIDMGIFPQELCSSWLLNTTGDVEFLIVGPFLLSFGSPVC